MDLPKIKVDMPSFDTKIDFTRQTITGHVSDAFKFNNNAHNVRTHSANSSASITNLSNYSLTNNTSLSNSLFKTSGSRSNITGGTSRPTTSGNISSGQPYRAVVNSSNTFVGAQHANGGGSVAATYNPLGNIGLLAERLATRFISTTSNVIRNSPVGVGMAAMLHAPEVGAGSDFVPGRVEQINKNREASEQSPGTRNEFIGNKMPDTRVEGYPANLQPLAPLEGSRIDDPAVRELRTKNEGFGTIDPRLIGNGPIDGRLNGEDIDFDKTRPPGTSEISNNNPRNFILLKDSEEALAKLNTTTTEIFNQGPNRWIKTGHTSEGVFVQRGLTGDYAVGSGIAELRHILQGTYTRTQTFSKVDSEEDVPQITKHVTSVYNDPIAVQARVPQEILVDGRTETELHTTRSIAADEIVAMGAFIPDINDLDTRYKWAKAYLEVLNTLDITPTPGTRGAQFAEELRHAIETTARYGDLDELFNARPLLNGDEVNRAVDAVLRKYS